MPREKLKIAVGPRSQNHLGRLICLDAATIKGVVDRIGARGLVPALNDPKDRRRSRKPPCWSPPRSPPPRSRR